MSISDEELIAKLRGYSAENYSLLAADRLESLAKPGVTVKNDSHCQNNEVE